LLANPHCLINFKVGKNRMMFVKWLDLPLIEVCIFWTTLRNDNDPCKRKRTL